MAKTESDSSSSLLNSNTNIVHNHNNNPNNHHNHNHTYIRHHRPSCDKSAGVGVNTHFTGTVTRASGNKLRNHHHPQHQHSANSVHHQTSSSNHNHNHRQHVAIATQVISPSAIGGSLKIGNRRFCKHYDHEQDDDDEDDHGIFSRRKRVRWGKLTCYGVSIGIILLILTGVVLCVGFLQAEKQKILTVKSQKLSLSQEPQKRNYNINVTLDSEEEEEDDEEVDDSDESESNPFMRATTWRPPTNKNISNDMISSSEVVTTSPTPTEESLQSPISKKNDDTVENSEKETQIPKQFLSENKDDNNKNSDHNEEDSDEEDTDDADSSSEEELEIYEPSLSQSPPHNNKNGESRKSEQTAQINARNDNVFLLFGNPDANTHTNTNPNTILQQFNLKLNGDVNPLNEALPSEVKVLPPQGFSFEFPILNNHNSTTTTTATQHQEKETMNSVNSDNNNNNITFPSFSFTNSINPTSSSSLAPFSTSSSVLPLPQSPVNDFPLIDLNFTFNPHASVLNYTEQQQKQQQQHIDSINNPFDFNPSKNILDDDMLKKEEMLQTENSFNTHSPYNNKDKSIQFQTEIFSADEEVGDNKEKPSIYSSGNNGIGKNSRSDNNNNNNNDDDSEMSASNKMRGRNPPKMTQADNTYTPRPGSNPNRPGRPLFSTKTKSLYNNNNNNNNNQNQNHNKNHNHNNNQHDSSHNKKNNDGMALVHFYSDRSEVKVPAPSSMTTPKPDNNLQFNFAQYTTTNSPSSQSQSSNTKDDNKGGSSSSSNNDVNLNLYNFNNVKSHSIDNPSSSSSSSSSSNTNFDLSQYQIVTPSTISNTNTNNPTTEFHFDFSSLTTPSPHTGATTSLPLNFDVNLNLPSSSSSSTNNNPDVLSKRTYNFDFDTAGSGQTSNYNAYGNYNGPGANFNPSGSNPFAHLLGPQSAVTGVIGQASSTGANLGYNFQDFNSGYNNNNNYNNYGGTSSSSSIPTGTIPLDLASSYIQVGFPGVGKSQNNYGSGDSHSSSASNAFDYTSAYANANPTLGIATLLQSGGGGGGGSGYNGGGFSSGLHNKQPDYNTITQGIHLLSLLSGSIPQHLLDSQPASSNIHSQTIAKPEYQIAALTGLGGSSSAFLHGLHSSSSSDSNSNSNGYSSNLHQLSPYIPAESRTLHTSSSDFHSSKSLPPPDQQTSFSQNIVTKLAEFSNIYKKSVGSTDPNGKAGDSLTSETAIVPSSISLSEPLIIREIEKSKENHNNNNNNMFQLKIDENSNLKSILEGEKGGGTNREIDKISDIPSAIIDVKEISKSTTSTSSASSSSLPDMETSASEARHILSDPSSSSSSSSSKPHLTNLIPSEKPRINFSKKLLIKTNKRMNENSSPTSEMRQEKGLKSGFYI